MAKGRKTGGRGKGSVNKATARAREAIARLVDANAAELQRWLDEVYKDKGAFAAFGCFVDLLEYHVPKLARTVIQSPDGSALSVTILLSNDSRSRAAYSVTE